MKTETIGQRVKKLRKEVGLTQTDLAKQCGVDQATVSKWERGIDKPGSKSIAVLADMAGVPVSAFLGIKPAPRNTTQTVKTFRVVAPLQAGVWREAVEWPPDEQYDVPIPWHPNMPDMPMTGYLVQGNSMNKVYPSGSLVFVSSTIANGLKPKSGQRVLVQRRNKDGLFEATLKEYIVDENGKKWLWPRSHDPEFQAPIEVGKSDDDITITGVVMYSFIAEPFLR